MDNYIGVKLDGRYELLELIGSGGMAEIYRADDTAEDRTVAVKILKNEFAGSEDFLRRFRNESKAIALLSHPNIVKIFDVGFTESVQFIVMEYIDGITLTEYIEKQGVLKWREALGFVQQILKALQHAHDRGIVHRDVKSQNVMLLPDGAIKVMDFGIARFNREIDKTISEKAIGSVHYISPEQARGDVTDERSDLYSVGIMLYEMLTGVKPFDGDDALAIALMHTNKNPKRPAEINSSIPEGLEEITLRAMQKEPPKRYQTAGEMVSDLREFERNPSVVFDYKYFTPDGNTKHFNKVGKAVPPPAPVPQQKKAPVAVTVAYDDDDDEEYDDDEIIERRSPLLPILFAVASVFVILAAWLIYMIVGNITDPSGRGPDGPIRPGSDIQMPNLVSMSYVEAIDLYGDRIIFDPSEEYSSEYPKGIIMEQEYVAGRNIKVNSTVKIVVSKGKNVVYVPDYALTGPHHSVSVEQELKNAGLIVRMSFIESETVPKEYVIRTDPPAGSQLEKGDPITIIVSLGAPESDITNVPDMLGLNITSARVRADEYRIELIEIYEESSEEDRGKVLSQSIVPFEEVPNWTEVEVVIGSGPPATRKSNITFTVADRWTGDYTFLWYVEGAPVGSMKQNVEIKKEVKWEFEDEGLKLYSIRIRCEATGEEALFCTYEIDFTKETPTKREVYLDMGVFSKISTPGGGTTATSTAESSEPESPADE
ncbi:MAG: Stk1 family PASTA domain-containing Ser/Thr kinase [Oscillospiraceae bacterium]|nr:Stk1 family PASTA domain-containing Ser/Thr kinase [Oscillospiraceae bacterium]